MLHFVVSQKQKIICFAIPCALIFGAAIWYLLQEEPIAHEQLVTKIDQVIRLKPTTKIAQTIFYEKCQEEEMHEVKVKSTEIGLNYMEFQALYPKWNIELFNEAQITMSLLDSGSCLAHRKHKFIGVQGDYVAIFHGKPEEKPILKELTQMKTSVLYPQALAEVKKGIVFQSNEEMLRILEGLHSK